MITSQVQAKQTKLYKFSKACKFLTLVFSKLKLFDFWFLNKVSIVPNLWAYSLKAFLGSILDSINQGSSESFPLAIDKLHLNLNEPTIIL